MSESYVTIATDDISSIEALVLCNSLKQTGTDKLLSVIINPSVSYHLKNVLRKSFDKVFFINDLSESCDEPDRFNMCGEYEKLKCWLLTDFTKCVFLESDVLVVENIDDLFDRMELSAATDPKWPDCFDTGVFVFQPSLKTYKKLTDFAITNHSVQDSLQCLLNLFFSGWNIINMERKIPFIYNCQINTSFYTHTTAVIHFGHSIKAARMGHSIFNLMQPDSSTAESKHENWSRLWSLWWKIFKEMVKPALDNDNKLSFKRTGCNYAERSENKIEELTIPEGKHLSESQQSSSSSSGPNIAYVCSGQDEGCSGQSISYPTNTSGCPNPESICPSQDFSIIANNSELTVQNTSQEEPCQTSCESFVESPIAQSLVETAESVKVVDDEVVKEEMEKTNRLRWERGEIDYMGSDSFDNILAKLNSALLSSSDEEQTNDKEE